MTKSCAHSDRHRASAITRAIRDGVLNVCQSSGDTGAAAGAGYGLVGYVGIARVETSKSELRVNFLKDSPDFAKTVMTRELEYCFCAGPGDVEVVSRSTRYSHWCFLN